MNMSFVDFKKIVDQFPRLSQITLQGVGEPLMAPDFFKMVRYVKKRNINVRFFTNGVLLNVFAVEIIENNIDMVLVSLDAASGDTFRAVRGKDLFLKVLSGIEALVSAKRKRGGKSSGMAVSTIVLKDNYQELTDIVELIYDMGVGEWRVGFPMFWGGKEELRQRLSLTAQEFKSMKEKIGVAQARALQLGINVIPKDTNTWTWIRTKCDVPWTGCYVTVEGLVTPCCVIADPAVINFGNLLERPFSEIRNNALFRTFRREMRSGIPRACIGCKYDPYDAILSW